MGTSFGWTARGARRGSTASVAVAAAVAAWMALPGAAMAGDAKGALAYKDRSATLRYAYRVTGPDAVDPKKRIQRLILTSSDIGAKLGACKAMSCTDGSVTEGMTLDIDNGPRMSYWVALNDQRVQYSGTARPEALTARTKEPARIAGTLRIDDSAAGGAKIEAEFDAALVKEFSAAR